MLTLAGCTRSSRQGSGSGTSAAAPGSTVAGPGPSTLPTVSNSPGTTPALQGGADGGGGNLLKDPPATSQEIDDAILQVKPYVERVLNFQEYLFEVGENTDHDDPKAAQATGIDHEDYLNRIIGHRVEMVNMPLLSEVDLVALRKAQRKMFQPAASKKRVFEILASVNFTPKKDGGCLDRYLEAHDGSSIPDVTSGDICLSRDRLTAQLTRSNVMRAVVALATHEISHRSGALEAEAVALQKTVEATLHEPTFEALFFDLRRNGPIQYFGAYVNSSKDFLNAIPLDELKFCGSLVRLVPLMEIDIQKVFVTGASAKPLVAMKLWDAAARQMNAVVAFCDSYSDNSPPSAGADVAIDWNHNPQVGKGSLNDLGPDSINGLKLDVENSKYMYGTYRDVKAAKFNFDQMYSNLLLYEDSNSQISFTVKY